jgi:hypothetical protein
LLQEYFSKGTAAEILGTTPELINEVYPHIEQKIGGFALYPVRAVAKALLEDRKDVEQVNAAKRIRMLANALVEKFPTEENEEKSGID